MARLLDANVTVKLTLDDSSRAALIALGWTPPPEEET